MDFKPLIKSFQQLSEEYWGDATKGDKVVEDLSKALTLGSYPTTAGTATTDAGALRLQNLDSMMTSVLFTEQHIKLWNFLTKIPSAQPYYEWNRRRGYGSGRGSAGFAEGGAPAGSAASYERNGIYTKFMGVRRGITHQLTLTGQLGGTQLNPVDEENRNGTMELLEKVERQLWFGDASILNEAGQNVNYDGILRQAKNQGAYNLGDLTKVVDKGGSPMNFSDFDKAATDLYATGFVSNFNDLHCFMSPNILTDLSLLKFQGPSSLAGGQIGGESVDFRMLGGSMPTGYTTGLPLSGHRTNFGEIRFDPWIFGERVKGDKPNTVADPASPPAPALPTIGINAPVVSGSKWTAAYAGSYYYTVAAFNDKGESLGSTSSANAAVATNGSLTVTFGAAPASATGWRVYRGTVSTGADAKWIADVPSATGTYEDKNTKIPGTGYCIILNKNPETLVIAQMTPLVRFPLAIVTTTIEWLLLLYHVPLLKAGERIYVWENVGRLT